MKIYISTDLEGVGGVMMKKQIYRENPEYAAAVHLLQGEVNAAIEGALAAGADEIIVSDSHGYGFNFPLETLHPAAEYVMGNGAPSRPRFPFLDESVDGMILLGYHSMAGTDGGVLNHTMAYSAWRNFYVNGTAMGEFGLDAAIAGAFGVPAIMTSGDDKLCAEAQRFVPGIITACVKKGIGREYALTKAPAKAREIIRDAAEQAVRNIAKIKPFKIEGPVEIKIEYDATDHIDHRRFDGVSVIKADSRTMIYKGKDYLDALYKAI